MRKQRGVTMIGWIFLLVPMALVLYSAIRVGPEYYGYYKLVSAMKGTASTLKSQEALTVQEIRGSLDRRFDADYVDVLKAEDIEVKREDAVWTMHAEYEKSAHLFGNLYLLLDFDETVVID
jgi:hypothetical protein